MTTSHRSVLLPALCLGLAATTAPAPEPVLAPIPHHPHDVVGSIAISPGFPQDPTILCSMAGTINLFLMSRDGGYTWREARSGLRGSKITAIEFHPDWVRAGVAWVAMPEAGIQATADFGTTWQPATIQRPVIAMDVARDGDGVAMYHATYTELFFSADGGKSDRRVELPIDKGHIDSVSMSPTYALDRTLAVTTSDARVLMSRDAGATWSVTRLPKPAQDIAFSPGFRVDNAMWAATWGGGVMTSTDGGKTFAPSGDGLADLFVNQVAATRKGGVGLATTPGGDEPALLPYDLFAATKDDGVYRSQDAGRTWTRTSLRVPLTDQTTNHHRTVRVARDGLGNATVICGTFEGLYVSNDNGDRWREANINATRNGRLIEISPTFREDKTIVAAGYGMHALISSDAGENWRVEWKFPAHSVYGIGVSPRFQQDRTLMLGLGGNIVRSSDGGATWQWKKLDEIDQVFYRNIWSFAYADGFGVDNRTVFALGYGGALYRSDDAGETWKGSRVAPPEEGKVTSTPDANTFWTTTVALSPAFASDQTMFVSGQGVVRSTDGGATFRRLVDGSCDERGVLVPPDFAATGELFGLVVPHGFVRFTDRGDKWTACNDGLEGFTPARARLSPDFAKDGTIFVATFGGGVFRSTDRGRTWRRVSPFPCPVDCGISMVVSPDFANDQTMFVGTFDGYYRSTDGGKSWLPVLDYEVYDDFRDPWHFVGGWRKVRLAGCMNDEVRTTANAGSNAELPFEGTGFQLMGVRGPDHGIAEIWLDGVLVGEVDLYAPALEVGRVVAERRGLPLGHHVLDVRVTGRKNAASAGVRVAIDGALVHFR